MDRRQARGQRARRLRLSRDHDHTHSHPRSPLIGESAGWTAASTNGRPGISSYCLADTIRPGPCK